MVPCSPLERHLSYHRRARTVTGPGVTDYPDTRRMATRRSILPTRTPPVDRGAHSAGFCRSLRPTTQQRPVGRKTGRIIRVVNQGDVETVEGVLALVDSNHYSQIQSPNPNGEM